MITNCQLTYMYVNDNNTTNDYIHVRTQLFLSTASTSAMAICQKSWTFFLVESPSSIPSLAELDTWETSDWDVCKTVSSTTKKLWPGGAGYWSVQWFSLLKQTIWGFSCDIMSIWLSMSWWILPDTGSNYFMMIFTKHHEASSYTQPKKTLLCINWYALLYMNITRSTWGDGESYYTDLISSLLHCKCCKHYSL